MLRYADTPPHQIRASVLPRMVRVCASGCYGEARCALSPRGSRGVAFTLVRAARGLFVTSVRLLRRYRFLCVLEEQRDETATLMRLRFADARHTAPTPALQAYALLLSSFTARPDGVMIKMAWQMMVSLKGRILIE